MSKHTKGNWLRDGRTVYALTESTKRGKPRRINRFMAQVQGGGRDGASEEELEANAEVMRAAPEMYQAIRAMLVECDKLGVSIHLRPYVRALRDALPKDGGE